MLADVTIMQKRTLDVRDMALKLESLIAPYLNPLSPGIYRADRVEPIWQDPYSTTFSREGMSPVSLIELIHEGMSYKDYLRVREAWGSRVGGLLTLGHTQRWDHTEARSTRIPITPWMLQTHDCVRFAGVLGADLLARALLESCSRIGRSRVKSPFHLPEHLIADHPDARRSVEDQTYRVLDDALESWQDLPYQWPNHQYTVSARGTALTISMGMSNDGIAVEEIRSMIQLERERYEQLGEYPSPAELLRFWKRQTGIA